MDKEILKNRDILNRYRADLKICTDARGTNTDECINEVNTKYLREAPGLKNYVYPWKNYDYNYDIFIDNNYSKEKTGASPKGTFGALFKNPMAIKKLMDGFVYNPNPNSRSSAANSDLDDCEGDKGCEAINTIKKSYRNQKPPYPDPFFNKNLDGESSSSFFIKTGTCPKNLDKDECLRKGYTWVPNPLYEMTPPFLRPPSFVSGSCYKDKYSYISNKSGLDFKIPHVTEKTPGMEDKKKRDLTNKSIDLINKEMPKFKGNIPSIMGDLLSLSPNNLIDVAKGKKNKYYDVMTCEEGFSKTRFDPVLIGLSILVIVSILIFLDTI